MTDPVDDAAPGTRRVGAVAAALGAVALVGAVVLFRAGGPPYGVNIGGGGLYLLGLLAGLIGTVLLWMGSSRHAVTGVALVLVCACPVLSISNVVTGDVQLVLMAVTAVALAAAALLSRRA
jgi:hypothetical protein